MPHCIYEHIARLMSSTIDNLSPVMVLAVIREATELFQTLIARALSYGYG